LVVVAFVGIPSGVFLAVLRLVVWLVCPRLLAALAGRIALGLCSALFFLAQGLALARC
jgi:hypothetical protein